jgi:PAS domain S-box-containing protein
MFKENHRFILVRVFKFIAIFIWAILIVAWFLNFPINPPFDLEDIVVEGSYFLGSVLTLFVVWNFPLVFVGWWVFSSGLLIDLLDEFTREPDLLSLYVESFLTITGLILISLGLKELSNNYRKNKNNLEIIMNSVPAMIWYKDIQGRFIRVNKKAAQLAGLQPEDFEGKTTQEIYPDESKDYREDDKEVLRTGKSKLGIVEPLQNANGEKIWVRTDKIPYKNQQGEIKGILVFSVDITKERESLKKIQKVNQVMVGREKKMIELKEKLKKLQN